MQCQMGLTLGRATTDVRSCPASWKWQHLSLTAEMTHAAAGWCALARVPFLGFGLRSPSVGPSPTAQFSSGTNRPRFCMLVSKPGRLSSVAARGAPASCRDCGWAAGGGGEPARSAGDGTQRMEVTARCERPTWLELTACDLFFLSSRTHPGPLPPCAGQPAPQ